MTQLEYVARLNRLGFSVDAGDVSQSSLVMSNFLQLRPTYVLRQLADLLPDYFRKLWLAPHAS